jgi:hypothetical protein
MSDSNGLEGVEDWLESSPVDWSQVMVARCALRVLPNALSSGVSEQWFDSFCISLLRACLITWILRNSFAENGELDSGPEGARAAADAAFVARAAARAADGADQAAAIVADAIANATDAARADTYPDFAARAAWQGITDAAQYGGMPLSVEVDKRLLIDDSRRAEPTTERSSERINRMPLWPASPASGGRRNTPLFSQTNPIWFDETWADARRRLLSKDASFIVWVNWFESLVGGRELAFCKNVDAENYVRQRLLEADSRFWRQDAVTINTTIIHWTEQFDLERRLHAFIDGPPRSSRNLGSDRELKARADLSELLRRLADLDLPTIGGVGHNQPPEPIEWQIQIVVSTEITVQASTAVKELTRPSPNPVAIAQNISVIGRGLTKLSMLSGLAADKAAEAFGKAIGAAAGIGLISVVALIWTGLLRQAIDWFASLL